MALIPKFFLDCVVAIGAHDKRGETRWIASGFLYGDFIKKDEKGGNLYQVYIVTNRHVLKELRQVFLRFNPTEKEAAKQYPLKLIDEKKQQITWVPHKNPDIDIAVKRINTEFLDKEGIQYDFFTSDGQATTLDKLGELGITEGDFIYSLGFPMELVGPERNYVIVRSGSIARIQDAIDHRSNEFLIDTFTFPGNSGGPVVIKPEAMAITDTKAPQRAYLIGVIQSYVPYQDVAISAQTKRPRVIFEENSGLTSVIPIDFVKEAIEAHKETGEKESPS